MTNIINNQISFQFLAEPTDVNFGGKAHGGAVMKWIDQAAFACASNWSSAYCVTVYVGGIRFYKPILIGDLVKIDARVIYTGKTSMHIMVDVLRKNLREEKAYTKTTHCIVVFVAVDELGQTIDIPQWHPQTEEEWSMLNHAKRLMELRKDIEMEMAPFKRD